MISEWMKVMLEEISRKKTEAEQARVEQQTRIEEQARMEQARTEKQTRVEQRGRRDDDSAQG